jgi:predicted methyltransferase
MMKLQISLCALLATLSAAMTSAATVPDFIARAVADAARPEEDRAQDINRHPGDALTFSGIKPGATVVDLMPGSGYYTRILSKVVGLHGKVYALQPLEMDKAAPKGLLSLHSFAGTAEYLNVTVLVQPTAALAIPEHVDLIFTSMNYHDLHDPFLGSPDMAKFDRNLYEALKPGGRFLILDHVAASGTGFAETDNLHRVDPAVVKTEVAAAGFEFAGESNVLSNAEDDHSLGVYNKAIRGKTDRFVYEFRRPLR